MCLATVLVLLAACSAGTPDDPPSEVAELRFLPSSADPAMHGARLARVLGCIGCHGEDLRGEDWSEPGFGTLWTSNLTRTLPSWSDAELVSTIRSGRRPDGRILWEMPSHLFTALSESDMEALIHYLRRVPAGGEAHPAPTFEEGARQEIASGRWKSSADHVQAEGRAWPPDGGPQHELGRYLVRATCAECHGMGLKGGQPVADAAPRPDLRIVGAYGAADFRRLLREGKAAGNRDLTLMGEVARGRYAHLTDEEIDAVFRYLQAIADRP